MNRLYIPIFILVCYSSITAHAQSETSILSARNLHTVSTGIFVNCAWPIDSANFITTEGNFNIYAHMATLALPFLFGWRHIFSRKYYGWYVEPQTGYITSFTDTDSTGKHNLKGWPDVNGMTGAIAAGYIFPHSFATNIGLKYQHIFVPGGPAANILSIRIGYTFIGRRRQCCCY